MVLMKVLKAFVEGKPVARKDNGLGCRCMTTVAVIVSRGQRKTRPCWSLYFMATEIKRPWRSLPYLYYVARK